LESAFNAARFDNYISCDNPSVANDLSDSTSNPETILIEKERCQQISRAYSLLSEEAKQLIEIILNCPSEILDLIGSPKTKKIHKGRIYHMLCKQWGEKTPARKLIKEMHDFVKEF